MKLSDMTQSINYCEYSDDGFKAHVGEVVVMIKAERVYSLQYGYKVHYGIMIADKKIKK